MAGAPDLSWEDGSSLPADLLVECVRHDRDALMRQLATDATPQFETEEIRINVAYSSVRFRQPEKWRVREPGVGSFFCRGLPQAVWLPPADRRRPVDLVRRRARQGFPRRLAGRDAGLC